MSASSQTAGKAHRRLDGWALASVPAILFMAACFLLPLVFTILKSLEGDAARNYITALTGSTYVKILLQTFRISGVVTVVCLLIGYPYAYIMSRAGGLVRAIMLAVVLLPVWTSFLVRSVALQAWLQDSGVINTVLKSLGLISEPLPLIRNVFGVTVGMAQILLPFMILPLFATMLRVPQSLTDAALSLGARPRQAFLRVYLPQTLPGILSGALLVFTISLGFFIVPAVLGGTEGTMLSKRIVELVQRNDAPLGSALAVVLLVATLLVLALGSRFVNIRKMVSGG
jgi:putative spermidine/putrescine transport system permease protein